MADKNNLRDQNKKQKSRIEEGKHSESQEKNRKKSLQKSQQNQYQRPPLNQQSPLRNKSKNKVNEQQIQQNLNSITVPNKGAYMEERHEQLKRQIAIKERLLAEMHSERESARRLRYSKHNFGNSLSKFDFDHQGRNTDTLYNDDYRINSNYQLSQSPLRNKSGQGSRPSLLKSKSYVRDDHSHISINDQLRMNPYDVKQTFASPVVQGSPLRSKNLPRSDNQVLKSPQEFKNILQQQSKTQLLTAAPQVIVKGKEEKERIYLERIETITLENASLQRRVKNVNEDLKIIKLHREELKKKMQIFLKENEILHKSVNQKDELDILNKNMQSDLESIRETNRKLEKVLFQEQINSGLQEKIISHTNSDYQFQVQDANSMTAELQKIFNILENLRQNHSEVLTKINLINIEIENISKEDTGSNEFNINLTKIVSKLTSERYELNLKVHAISEDLDDLINKTTQDRNAINQDFKLQNNLMTSKILHNGLNKIQQRIKQESLQDLKDYCHFDKSCQYKLKQFQILSHRLGKFIKRYSLYKWYFNALKPMGFKGQNTSIQQYLKQRQIKSQVFFAWRSQLSQKVNSLQISQQAAQIISFFFQKQQQKENKRLFQIWKETNRFHTFKLTRILILIKQNIKRNLQQHFTEWSEVNKTQEYYLRQNLLKQEYSNKLLKSYVFGQIQVQSRYLKQKRLRSLRRIFNAWIYFQKYSIHLIHANMTAIKYIKTNQKFTKRDCFDSLKMNKETKKHRLLKAAVDVEMLPTIQNLQEFNYQKSVQILNVSQRRACQIVVLTLKKQLKSYIKQWLLRMKNYDIILNKIIKQRLIKLYKGKLWTSLTYWKINIKQSQNTKINKINVTTLQDNEQLSLNAFENEQILRSKEESVRTLKRRLLDKLIRKNYLKKEYTYLKYWSLICQKLQFQELKVRNLVVKRKKRLLNDAFQIYLQHLKWCRTHDKNIIKSVLNNNKINFKNLKKYFKGLMQYCDRQKKAKRYWSKILNRMDRFIKLRAISIWRDISFLNFQDELQNQQKAITDLISDRNQRISQLESSKIDQDEFFQNINLTQQKKAYLQIGNYFFRTYTQRTSECFKKWKFQSENKNHKQNLLKKTVQHWRMNTFSNCRQLFKYFISNQKQNEIKNELKRIQIESQAIIQNTKFEKEKSEANTLKQNKTISIIEIDQKQRRELCYKLMMILERRSKEWIYVSQKRMVFLCWREVFKQQKAFTLSVKNVLEKSMYMKGFYYIKNGSNSFKKDNLVYKSLKRLVLKSQKNNFMDCFCKWKQYCLQKTNHRAEKIQDKLNEVQEEFSILNNNVKSTNGNRILLLLNKNNLANMFQAFKNVLTYKKLQRMKTVEFKNRQERMRKQIVVQWWNYKNKIIQSLKTRQILLSKKIKKSQLKLYFKELKIQNKINFDLVNNISILEKLMRDKILSNSLKTIQSFSKSKNLVQTQNKYVSTNDFIRIVRQKHFKGSRYAFQTWKNYSFGIKLHGSKKLKQLYTKISSNRLRDAFNWWQRKDFKLSIVIENNQEGPVRCQFWEIQREISNLKEFMKKERYTENEIDETYQKIDQNNLDLLKKYILRMKLKVDQNSKYVAYAWERLKMFCVHRKYIKYQFNLCMNRSQNIKIDLQRAFIQWKKSHYFLKKELSKFRVDILVDFALKSTDQVGKLCQTLITNQAISGHLLVQRDEFLKYYIKSQVLAMVLLRDRERFAMMQAWSRWNRKNDIKICNQLREKQKDADKKKAELEAKQKELNQSNTYFKSENKELSEFTDDQKIVIQNYNIIKKQNDQTLEELQETEEDFNELMKENQRLKQKVEDAEKLKQNQKNRKFINPFQLKEKNQEEPALDVETSEQKKRREQKEKFQRLLALQKGQSIR